MKRARDDAWLLRMAKRIAQELRSQASGTSVNVRQPRRVHRTGTNGWAANIGGLGHGQPGLEIWLDHFSGHPNRKFYACFYSKNGKAIKRLAYQSKSLWPVRKVTDDDLADLGYSQLKSKLLKKEFNAPVLEDYKFRGHHFFGVYDQTQGPRAKIETHFSELAIDFFIDVAASLPRARIDDTQNRAYPRCENRKWVRGHLARERNRSLARYCKDRDDFCCQVCYMKFSDTYGHALGSRYAEAHHIIPLGKQSAKVKTKPEDLVTVCANCHRMLHRMDGKMGDLLKLRAIVRKNTT